MNDDNITVVSRNIELMLLDHKTPIIETIIAIGIVVGKMLHGIQQQHGASVSRDAAHVLDQTIVKMMESLQLPPEQASMN